MPDGKPNSLAMHRKAKRMTQAKLAELLGVHWITVSKLERGKMALSWERAVEIAGHLGIRPADLFSSRAELVAIGQRLKEAREAKGWTQSEAAAAGGSTQGTISKWEAGTQSHEGLHLARYCEAIGISMADALGLPPSSLPVYSSAGQMVAGYARTVQADARKPQSRGEPGAATVLECLTAYVREHGKREGLLDALLPPERQDEPIGLAMRLIESLTRE